MLPAKKKSSADKQNIKVMVRVRPMTTLEESTHVQGIIKIMSQREIAIRGKKYTFDRVFAPETDQREVYLSVVAPMVPDVIAGYNCTVFAYGQTGSGKTFTMTGVDCQCPDNWREDLEAGCIPRAATHIFDQLVQEKCARNVKISYLELYNEEIRDLLSDDEVLLPIYNDTKGCVFIHGLTEVSVHDQFALCRQLQKGILKRQTAATLVNHQSSRSHTVLTITIHTRETLITGEDILKTGKLNLVDLAGSENIARSGCKDVRALELANINRSLLTLGRVIHALADKGQRHVPYRDSKLTRILQDSLGGHTKTCIIATISLATCALDETTSTLEYATRARDIKNTPILNEKLTKAQMIQGLLQEIERLQRDLNAARDQSGFFVDKTNYEKLIESFEVVTGEKLTVEEISRKQAKRINELETILISRTNEFDNAIANCKKSKELLTKAKEVIKKKKDVLIQEQFVSQTYEAEASHLHEQAEHLLSTTKVLSVEKEILHGKLEKQFDINVANQNIGQGAVSHILGMLNEISEQGKRWQASNEESCKVHRQDVSDLETELKRPLEEVNRLIQMFDSQRLRDMVLRASIKAIINKNIDIVKERTLDVKSLLAQHVNQLETITAEDVANLVEGYKKISHNYVYTVHDLIVQIHKTLEEEDSSFFENITKLEEEVQIQMKQTETVFKQKMEQDVKILQRIQVIKDQYSNRNYADRGQKLLLNLIDAANKTKEQNQIIVENFEGTIKNKLSGAPAESTIDHILNDMTIFSEEINSNLIKHDESQQMLKSLSDSVKSKLARTSDVLNSKVNIMNSRIDFLVDDRETFEVLFNHFVSKTRSTLEEGLLKKLVHAEHKGDTPSRSTTDIPKTFQPVAPREVLVEKFKQQKPLFTDQEKENLDDLSESSISLKSFLMFDSDSDVEGPGEPPN